MSNPDCNFDFEQFLKDEFSNISPEEFRKHFLTDPFTFLIQDIGQLDYSKMVHLPTVKEILDAPIN